VIDCGGYLELVENKFVGQIDALTIRKLNLDRQLALECYGLWRATGKPVRQVRYRFTRKPSIKPRKATAKKPAESVDEFIERLEADYRPGAARVLQPRGAAVPLRPGPARDREEPVDVGGRAAPGAPPRPLRPGHLRCSDWGGCPFIPLCVGDPDARSLYQTRPAHEEDEEEEAA
jgi:hypothetical protein